MLDLPVGNALHRYGLPALAARDFATYVPLGNFPVDSEAIERWLTPALDAVGPTVWNAELGNWDAEERVAIRFTQGLGPHDGLFT